MLIVPIETPGHVDDMIVVVLGDDSLERMAHADPAEVKIKETGRNLVSPRILICHEKDSPEFARVLQSKDIGAIMRFLSRGFEFRPDKGDHDNGPTPLGSIQ